MNRRLPVALIAAVCFAGAARANERIELFSDEALTDKTLSDTAPRIVEIYVAHFDVTGSTGCEFSIKASPGFTGVWLGDTSSYITVGDSRTGIAVAYAECFVGSSILVKVKYQLFGTSACSSLRTGRYKDLIPDYPVCDYCFGGYGLPSNSLSVNCPVNVGQSTWGAVKALYR